MKCIKAFYYKRKKQNKKHLIKILNNNKYLVKLQKLYV